MLAAAQPHAGASLRGTHAPGERPALATIIDGNAANAAIVGLGGASSCGPCVSSVSPGEPAYRASAGQESEAGPEDEGWRPSRAHVRARTHAEAADAVRSEDVATRAQQFAQADGGHRCHDEEGRQCHCQDPETHTPGPYRASVGIEGMGDAWYTIRPSCDRDVRRSMAA
jgi:hypothetical protein